MDIALTAKRIFCHKHVDPWLGQWPKPVPFLSQKLWNQVKLVIPEYEGKESMDDWIRASNRFVEKLLDEKPLCCRVSNEIRDKIYSDCPHSRLALCVNCNTETWGTAGFVDKIPKIHICFRCYRKG